MFVCISRTRMRVGGPLFSRWWLAVKSTKDERWTSFPLVPHRPKQKHTILAKWWSVLGVPSAVTPMGTLPGVLFKSVYLLLLSSSGVNSLESGISSQLGVESPEGCWSSSKADVHGSPQPERLELEFVWLLWERSSFLESTTTSAQRGEGT